jgi:hypothetical protein
MEKARRIHVEFGAEVPGCNEPTDATSEDEEIQAFQEEGAALLYNTDE